MKKSDMRRHFYKTHLERRPGSRGRKTNRLSMSQDLHRLAKSLGLKLSI